MMEKGLSAQSKVTVDGGNVAATMGIGRLAGIRYAGYGGPDGKCGDEGLWLTICRKVRRPSVPR